MSAAGELPGLRIGPHAFPLPIVQGGMGVGISLAGLASAVSGAGALGVISAIGLGTDQPDFRSDPVAAHGRALAREVRRAKTLTPRCVGVNVMMALTDAENLMSVAADAGAGILFLGAGLPLGLPARLLRSPELALVPIVSSPRAARTILRWWRAHHGRAPDGFVVEGPRAGGHLGFTRSQLDDPACALDALLQGVLAEVSDARDRWDRPLPVIAAGGVYSEADVRRLLALGAAGVQLGTRFVATEECDAAPAFKQAYLSARPEDVVLIDSPVGLVGRALRNEFLARVAAGERRPVDCVCRCLKSCDAGRARFCIAEAMIDARNGRMAGALVFAGANVGRVDRIVPVRALLHELTGGAA